MEDKNITVLIIIGFIASFYVARYLTEDRPVLIKRDHYEILMKIRYLEHEGYVSSLTNDRSDKSRYDMYSLLEALPKEYHQYIDTQDYINCTKVAHIRFEVY